MLMLPLRRPVREIPSPLWRGYFFVKPFKTIEEQIILLKQRGLIIPDEDKAKKSSSVIITITSSTDTVNISRCGATTISETRLLMR